MWVYAYKFDPARYILFYKARIVVRGDQQPHTELSVAASNWQHEASV